MDGAFVEEVRMGREEAILFASRIGQFLLESYFLDSSFFSFSDDATHDLQIKAAKSGRWFDDQELDLSAANRRWTRSEFWHLYRARLDQSKALPAFTK